MTKVKITKQELKKQKDSLARFERYLPTLQLKKKQLQRQIIKVRQEISKLEKERDEYRKKIDEWVDLFARENPLNEIITLESVLTRRESIAGVDLPVFEKAEFKEKDYDLFSTPLWFDAAVESVKEMITFRARSIILERQLEALKRELNITNQRVNLFEKIKIPEAQENIRVIQIYLGERRTAAVVRGKIAKKKIKG